MIGNAIRKLAPLGLALCAAAMPGAAQAQYPERNVTLIVPYAAGGGTDISARLLARDLEVVLGKPVTVENRAGGGGWVGWGGLAAGKPDGYLLGYLIASWMVGTLAAGRGTFGRVGAMLAGMVPIYAIGMAWLAAYVPAGQLLAVGVLPFLLGDLVKIGVVAAVGMVLPASFARLRGKGE